MIEITGIVLVVSALGAMVLWPAVPKWSLIIGLIAWLALAAGIMAESLGRGKPAELEIHGGTAQVVAHHLEVNRAIHVLAQTPGGLRYYILPWSVGAAQRLQDAAQLRAKGMQWEMFEMQFESPGEFVLKPKPLPQLPEKP